MLYLSALILIPSLLFLSILGFIKRKSYDTTHSLIHYLMLLGLSSEALMLLCASYFKNNIPIYNLINLVEFFLVFYFYFKFIRFRLNKFIYLLILFGFLLFYSFEFFNKGIFNMFVFSFLYKNIALVILAVIAFEKIISAPQDSLISDYSIFWINTAILIYYSCTLFIFGLRKYTVHLPTLTLVTVYLHIFFILVFYSLLSIGLWKTSKK